MIIRPIDSFVKYFNEIKPYHTKILEVVEQYRFNEDMTVSMVDKLNFVETLENTPLCNGVGFGLDFDDDSGFDALSNCNLGNCNGGYGMLYNNSDLLVDAPVIAHDNGLTKLVLQGDFRFDTSLQIHSITANTIKILGNVASKITPHSVFLISPKSTLPILETTTNGFYVENDHKLQFNGASEFVVSGATLNDNTYNVISAEYDLATNRTFITTVSTDGPLNASELGTISVNSYTKNNGFYSIGLIAFDGTYTVITLSDGVTLPLPDETVHGSIVLRTGLIPSRRVWLHTGVSLDEGAIVDDGDVLDNMSETRIVQRLYDSVTNTTSLILDIALNYNLSTVLTVQLRGYSFGAGFDGFKECTAPKPENLHAGFSEHLWIQVVPYVAVTPTPTATITVTPTVTPAITVTPTVTPSSVALVSGLAYFSPLADETEIGYGTFSGASYTHIAKKTYGATSSSTPGYNHTVVAHGNTIFALLQFDMAAGTESGIVALQYDGTSTLLEQHTWRIGATSPEFASYAAIGKLTNGTIIVTGSNPDTEGYYVAALSYSEVTGFAQIAYLDVPSYSDLIVHNDNIILQYDNTFTGYNISGATFVESDSEIMTVSGQQYASNGGTVVSSYGNTLTYDGTTMTETVTTNTDLGVDITIDNSRSVMIGNNATSLKAYNASYTATATYTLTTAHSYSVHPLYVNDYILIPAGTGRSSDASGIYSWNGTSFSRLGALIVYTSFTPTTTALFKVPVLTV